MEYVLIHPDDNVRVSLENGHKYAVCDIKKGGEIIKYGYPIGTATEDISAGSHVHSHNLKTSLSGELEYTYMPYEQNFVSEKPFSIMAYKRKNGQIGIRNDIWIIPTVGCINVVAGSLAQKTGAFAFTHPYGCSQLGDDLLVTQKVLCNLIKHPNTHLWKKQNGFVDGRPVFALDNGKSNFGGEIRQMMPPFMLSGENTAEMLISNMDYAGVNGAVITQEEIDGNQDSYLLSAKEKYP